MASVPYYYFECNQLKHRIYAPQWIPEETLHDPPPVALQIELDMSVNIMIVAHDCISSVDSRITSFTDLKTLRFDLDLLRNNPDQVHQLIASTLTGFGINSNHPNVVEKIIRKTMEYGLRIGDLSFNMGCKILPLYSRVRGTVLIHSATDEVVMRDLLAASAAEFEANNYGMIPAKESSVNKMLKTVRLEDNIGDDNEDACMICLEGLNVESCGLRMPCSHTFHGDCIKTWLNRSHYCPICRFEMPTN